MDYIQHRQEMKNMFKTPQQKTINEITKLVFTKFPLSAAAGHIDQPNRKIQEFMLEHIRSVKKGDNT